MPQGSLAPRAAVCYPNASSSRRGTARESSTSPGGRWDRGCRHWCPSGSKTGEPTKTFCRGSAARSLQDALDHSGARLVHTWGESGPALSPPQRQNISGNIYQNICPGVARGKHLPSPDINALNTHSPRAGILPGTSCLQTTWRNIIKPIPGPWEALPGSGETPKM